MLPQGIIYLPVAGRSGCHHPQIYTRGKLPRSSGFAHCRRSIPALALLLHFYPFSRLNAILLHITAPQ
jgi:hypothetical protein